MKKRFSRKSNSAFTLIELIIVIAIIAILAAAIFVAVDPARRLHEARNARRFSDTATILEAVKTYQVDNGGTHYTTIAAATAGLYFQIGTNGVSGCDVTCAGAGTGFLQDQCVDISALGSGYLATVPKDPQTTSTTGVAYFLVRGDSNEITIGACNEEAEGAGGAGTTPTIEVSR